MILKPSERDPSCPDDAGRTFAGSGPARRCLPGTSTATRRAAGRHPPTTPRSRPWASSVPPPSRAIHLRTCRPDRQARAVLRRCQEPHDHHAATPTWSLAADALVGAGYGAAGERCMASLGLRCPVGEETADRLIEKLVPRIEALKVGPYTAGNDVDFGPVVTAAAKANILRPGRKRRGDRAPSWSSTGATSACRATRNGVLRPVPISSTA